jgi:hypothetical protein
VDKKIGLWFWLAALIILPAFVQPQVRGAERIRFGAIADVHNGHANFDGMYGMWPFEKRWFSNAPVRMAAFAEAMEVRGDIDFCVDLGDIVDKKASYEPSVELMEITDALENNWSGEIHYVVGNHEYAIWSGGWLLYKEVIPQDPPGMNDYWVEGKPTGCPTSLSYSFVKNGIHFVILGHVDSCLYEAQRTWLNNNLAATSLPIVVFSHVHLHDSAGWLATRDDWQEIQAILESYNVQAVLQGHVHPIPEVTDFLYVKSGIPYFNLRGSLLGPLDGSYPAPSDNAYYVFEIEPNAAQGKNRQAALITVKGYGKGLNASGYVYGNSWVIWPTDGDIDKDGNVDIADLTQLTLAWITEAGDDQWIPDCDISAPADNRVNALDFIVLSKNWAKSTPPIIPGDFNKNGNIDTTDLAIFTSTWLTEAGDIQWNPDCDISIPADNHINLQDFIVFSENWAASVGNL